MILRLDDMDCDVTHAPRGGKGSAECFPYKALYGLDVKIKTFNMMNLAANSAIGYHKHENDMEGYLILDGSAQYNDNGEEHTLDAGDLAICYKGESHSLAASGTEAVTFLAFILELNETSK